MIRINGRTWVILKEAEHGCIAVLVVEGKQTEQRAYFPWSTIQELSDHHGDIDEETQT